MTSNNADDLQSLLAELRNLRIREDEVIRRIGRVDPNAAPVPPSQPPAFTVGDRVRITNPVSRPARWTAPWDQAAIRLYRAAVVTSVEPHRIGLLTVSGISTWRAPHNLRRC